MPWINIFDPLSPFDIDPIYSDEVSESGGSLVCNSPDGPEIWFIMDVIDPRSPDAEVRLRVTVVSYQSTSGKESMAYVPSVFQYPDKSDHPNQFAPYPDPVFPPDLGSVNGWDPSVFEVTGTDSLASLRYTGGTFGGDVTNLGESWEFLIEAWSDEAPPEVDCCPKSGSRLFKGIASKYRANQHQPVRARRFQKRCLQVDFSGALEKDEKITKVTWECYSPWVTFMQDACVSLDGKRVCVDVTLNYSGIGDVKATVETTSGTVENYEFSITVTDAPMYPSAQYIPSNGPYKIVVDA